MAAIPQQVAVPTVLSLGSNVKDSRWLTLEVCREFQRTKCSRSSEECKFAHPPPHVEVTQGRVTCCFDAIKGKCQRKEPPCKYLHPPQHLREQVLQSGKNNLIMKNLQQQSVMASYLQPQIGLQGATVAHHPSFIQAAAVHPYMQQTLQQMTSLPPANEAPVLHTQAANIIPTSQAAVAAAAHATKVTRADRLEVCREYQRGTCTRQPSECRYAHPPESVTIDSIENTVTVCMDHIKGKCSRESCRYFHPPTHLQAQVKATQQRANAAAVQAQAALQPQMVEVIQPKKRPLEATDDLLLQAGMPMTSPNQMMEQLYKRPAMTGKGGMPMYQPPSAASYQQQIVALQQLQQQQQQQQYIPVS
ncbi:unnamed protein product, partial [Owenia fusiformis]